jgi:hypothetical protein
VGSAPRWPRRPAGPSSARCRVKAIATLSAALVVIAVVAGLVPDLVDVDEPVELVRRDGLAGGQLRPGVADDDVHHVGRVEHYLPGMTWILLQQLCQRHPLLGLAQRRTVLAVHRADRRAGRHPVAALLAGVLRRRGATHWRDAMSATPQWPIALSRRSVLETHAAPLAIINQCEHDARPSAVDRSAWTVTTPGPRSPPGRRPDPDRLNG